MIMPIDPADVPGLIAEQQRHADRHRMLMEDQSNRWMRLISEELDPDQLGVLRWVLSLVAGSGDPQAVANFYEGMAAGAGAVRKARLGEDETPRLTEEDSPGRHDFQAASEDDPYCAREGCGLPVFNRCHL